MVRGARTELVGGASVSSDSPVTHVLVVGLDATRRMRFEYRLLESGVALRTVTFAESLSEALGALESTAPECVLVDLELREPTPVAAVAELVTGAPDVPVVVMTSSDGDRDLVQRAMLEGAVDHLVDEGWQPVALADLVTRAHRRHEELRAEKESRAALGALLDLVEGQACVVDAAGRILAVNASWAATAEAGGGSPLSCGAGASYLRVCEHAAADGVAIAGEVADGIRAVLDATLPRFSLDYPCLVDKEEHRFSLRVAPHGERGNAVIVHEDVTDVRRTEDRLRHAREAARRELDDAHEVVALVAADGTVADVSEATRVLLGPSGTTRGRPSFLSTGRRDREEAEQAFAHALAAPGARSRVTIHVLDAAGRTRELDLEICNRLDDPLVEAVTVAGADVTDARRTERRRQLDADVLGHLPAAVVACDDGGAVVAWNAEAARLFGRPASEALGMPVRTTGAWPPAVFDARSDDVVLPGGTWEGAHAARTADGSDVVVRTALVRVDGEAGFQGVVAVSSEVSEPLDLPEPDAAGDRTPGEDAAYETLHDAVTGLPGDRLFADHLRRARAKDAGAGRHTAILVADLDDAETVLGDLGDEADSLLRSLAERLGALLGPGDLLARLGAGTFAVCCEGLAEHGEALILAERVRRAFATPVPTHPGFPTLSASVGVAVADPSGAAGEDADALAAPGSSGVPEEPGARPAELTETGALRDADPLLRDARAAVQLASEKGKGCVELFDGERHRDVRDRFEMAADLSRAVELGEIDVEYQPLFELSTGALYGFEALARWTHPEWGVVPPSDFIRVAEMSGSITELGEAVLGAACTMLAGLLEARSGLRVTMTVNVSTLQLADPAFFDMVTRVVERAGVPPELVCLEVSESALTDADAAVRALETLKARGVQTSIDDFGIEYASLARLHQFPIDYLKIDRTFVAGASDRPVDAAIVHALLGLARSLGIRSVAEGVEDDEQLRLLVAAGCDLGQGFYWSKPLPADDAARLVQPV